MRRDKGRLQAPATSSATIVVIGIALSLLLWLERVVLDVWKWTTETSRDQVIKTVFQKS